MRCLARLPGWHFDEWRSVFIACTRRSLGQTTIPLANGLNVTLEPAVEARVEIGLRGSAKEWTAARLDGLSVVDRWLRQGGHDEPGSSPRAAGVGLGALPGQPAKSQRRKPLRGAP